MESSALSPVSLYHDDDRLRKAWIDSEEQGSISPLIKEELRLTIMNKRVKKGQQDIDTSPTQTPFQMTDEDIQKRERRRDQNRRAAEKCRFKKKACVVDKEKERADLVHKNGELNSKISELRKQLAHLQDIYSSHVNSGYCCRTSNEPSMFETMAPESTTPNTIHSNCSTPVDDHTPIIFSNMTNGLNDNDRFISGHVTDFSGENSTHCVPENNLDVIESAINTSVYNIKDYVVKDMYDDMDRGYLNDTHMGGLLNSDSFDQNPFQTSSFYETSRESAAFTTPMTNILTDSVVCCDVNFVNNILYPGETNSNIRDNSYNTPYSPSIPLQTFNEREQTDPDILSQLQRFDKQ